MKRKFTALILIFVCICSLSLSACKKAEAAPIDTPEPVIDQETMETQETELNLAPGTFIESGNNLNENYYKGVHFWGMASNVTDNSFELAKDAMAYDGSAVPIVTPFTVSYDENTVVRVSVLYYADDTYEIYAAATSDLKMLDNNPDFMFDVFLEDPNAET